MFQSWEPLPVLTQALVSAVRLQILVALGVPPVCACPVLYAAKVQEEAGIALARAQGPGSALACGALGTEIAHTGETPNATKSCCGSAPIEGLG